MLDLLKLFTLRDTRDELGIGTVRDAFANYFFPGTSTIQTRARYFLVVPWIYQEATKRALSKGWSEERIAREIDYWERSVIRSLQKGGETDGVIGGSAGQQVQRLPSSIYWQGLLALGIRIFQGSQSDLVRTVARQASRAETGAGLHSSEYDEETKQDSIGFWHSGLPLPPKNMWEEFTLSLTREEAEYLRERIRYSHPHSLFSAFLQTDPRPLKNHTFFWDHPLCPTLPGGLKETVETARLFSLIMHGAAYLYNLMLAIKWKQVFKEDKEGREAEYRKALSEWSELMENNKKALDVLYSDSDKLWQSEGLREWHEIPATRAFVNRWLGLLSDCNRPVEIVESQAARKLIREREYFLKKGNRARLWNIDSLRRWSGAAGTGRLDYRWGTARTLVRDIWQGRTEGDSPDA